MAGILIIEHRKDWIKILSDSLALLFPEAGVRCVCDQTAASGYVNWHELDVIILGTLDAAPSRFELCRQLKQGDGSGEIPLLFLVAAQDDLPVKAEAMDAGADAYLSFPPDLPEMALQIKAMVQISRFRHAVGESEKLFVADSCGNAPLHQRNKPAEKLTRLAEADLGDSQTLFESILNSTTDLIWLVNAEDFGLLRWNTAFYDYFLKERGIEIEIGMTPSDLLPEDSHFIAFWADKFSRTLSEGSLMLEYTTFSKTEMLLLNLGLLVYEDRPYGISIFAKNITRQKQAEEKLQKLNRLYGVISQINQTIVHTKEKELLLKEVCRIAVEEGKFRMAWIGFVDEERQVIIPKTYAGYEEGYLTVMPQIAVNDIPTGRGPTGRAVREGIHVVCDDYSLDPTVSLWREMALQRGYRSSISLPIALNGKVEFAITLYAEFPCFFDRDEIKLLSDIALNIGFALENILLEQNSQIALKALNESEKRYRLLFDNSLDALLQTNPDGSILSVNKATCRMFGRSAEEICRLGRDGIIDSDDPRLKEAVAKRNETGSFFGELTGIKKDGSTFPIEMTSTLFLDDGGKQRTSMIIRDITARKHAEEEIKRSKERFQTMFMQAPMGIALVDSNNGKISEVNRKFEQITGKSREELNSMEWMSITHPDDIKEELLLMEQMNSGEISGFRMNKRFIGKEGSVVWVSMTISSLLEQVKSNPRHLCMVEDVTDRIFNEDKIRILTSAVEQSPVSIVITGTNGDIEYVNPKFSQITGYSSEEAIGQNPRILKSGSKPSEDYKVLWETITSGKEWHGEFLNVKKNGEQYFESASISPVFDENGVIVHFIAVKEDITDRKRKEEQINTLSTVVEQSPLMIVITDKSGKIEYINTEFSRFMQYSSADILGTIPRIFRQKHHTRESYDRMWRTLQTGQVWQSEFKNRKKDGTVFWENVTISPLKGSSGRTSNYIIIKENINEKKELIGELIGAKEKAEESDRLKTSFLANMSHEIRTPMNGILGFTELLKEPNLSGNDQKFYIQVIEESGARMLNLMNNLIDISRIESGEINVFNSAYDIKYKLEHIFDFFVREAEQKGLQLKLINDFHSQDTLIRTDAQKLDAIVINLVKNAIKFTKAGSVEFGCEWKEDHFLFYVRDTGVGIDPQYHEIIFDRFRQASESLSRPYEGAGLGLSISKAYTEILGGRIWVESEAGKGSVFYFTLPVGEAFPEKGKIQSDHVRSSNSAATPKLKILLVEDDDISMNFIEIIAHAFASQLLKAKTGLEAVEIARKNSDLALILMDIKMPVMDGLEATRLIREFNREVMIIAQTAYSLTGDREKALEAGCNDYLSKPIKKEELVGKLKLYLK